MEALIALDYSVNEDVRVINLSNTFKCQRCGSDSTSTLCSNCIPRHINPTATNFAASMFKTVSVRGCEIYVNHKYYMKRPTHELANQYAEFLRKSFDKHNGRMSRLLK